MIHALEISCKLCVAASLKHPCCLTAVVCSTHFICLYPASALEKSASMPFLGHTPAPQVWGQILTSVFEVWPYQYQVQEDNHFPSSAISDISQDAIGHFCHWGMLLTHAQPAVSQHPKVLFHWVAFQLLFPKSVVSWGYCDSHVEPGTWPQT